MMEEIPPSPASPTPLNVAGGVEEAEAGGSTNNNNNNGLIAAGDGHARSVLRNRLPSLKEVLSRSTRPPVDLYCYYLFLQRESGEDYLDFWLDVHQHESLVRAYFKDLARDGRSLRDEWPEYYETAKKRGSAWNGVNGITREAASLDEKQQQQQQHEDDVVGHQQPTAMFTPAQMTRTTKRSLSPSPFLTVGDQEGSPNDAQLRSSQRTPSPTSNGPRPNLTANFSPTLRALYPHDRTLQQQTPSPGAESTEFGVARTDRQHAEGRRRSSLGVGSLRGAGHKKHTSTKPIIPRDSAITRMDLVASAERIYVRYLMPGGEKEIFLPNVLRINDFPSSMRQDYDDHDDHRHPDDYVHGEEKKKLARVPDMFHSQKEWVYRAMEQDSFPRFLRSKAFGNLTPISALCRLVVGLFCMWIALSASFALVFLDVKPKSHRLWIILPYTVAFFLILSYAYDLDPLLVFVGVSETTAFRTLRIREPYVKKLLIGRAVWVTFLALFLMALATLLFTLVPGHRL